MVENMKTHKLARRTVERRILMLIVLLLFACLVFINSNYRETIHIRQVPRVRRRDVLQDPIFKNSADELSFTKQEVVDFVKNVDTKVRGHELDYKQSGGGTDVARIISMMSIKDHLEGKAFERALLINEGDMSNPYIETHSKQVDQTQYKKTSTGKVIGDIHDLNYIPGNSYDLIYMPQTLEHAHNPFLAIQNIYRITNHGGLVISSQPFITRPHMTPIHYFGFTPYGVESVFSSSGFVVEKIKCWGNDEYAKKVLIDRKWPKLNDMEDFSTSKNRYAQCTIFAKKN
uniref:Methyltransferase type 11 domain-containing protein n=1 Tax=Mucochytrium quahogii TaxID=96639 RepID=A0A7S2RQ23_9STRA|mmetsp:Transcript_23935/g.38177  ORF Transcript_23935/g.38177 Transcript_23935/m.38177 type:complete len:287 (+) Transcript_23935:372-1232(+)